MGGVARRATLLADVKRKHQDVPVLVVETGNALRQTDNLDDPSNRWVLEAFDALGVDAVNTTEPDLRRLERLQGLGLIPAELRSRYIATALQGTSSLQFPTVPYSVFALQPASGGVEIRVGVLGVAGDASAAGEIPMQDPAAALKRVLPEVEKRADLVVVLARMRDPDLTALAQAFPAVDVIINGSSVSDGRELPRLGNTVVVESAHSGIGLGVLEVAWDGGGRITTSKNEMILLPSLVPDAPGLVSVVDKARRDLSRLQEEEARKSPQVTARSLFAGADACKICHEKAYTVWQKSRHARAIETLVRAGNQFNQDCVSCHVTGFGSDRGFVNMLRTPKLASVQCEACHGESVDHARSPQTIHPGLGVLQQVRRPVKKEFCPRCHTPENSPNFQYERYWPKIAH